MFTNMVRTNGYGIDFILVGPKKQTSDLPVLDLSDFTAEEISTRFHLWGADHGMTNVYIPLPMAMIIIHIKSEITQLQIIILKNSNEEFL